MNEKAAKKIRQWARRRYREQFSEYTTLIQQQPLKKRLYFAFHIVFKCGYNKEARGYE